MTSNDDILSIKLFLEVGNDKYNIMCNFGDHNMSAFEVIGGPSAPRLNNSPWPWGLSVCHLKVDATSNCFAKTKSRCTK